MVDNRSVREDQRGLGIALGGGGQGLADRRHATAGVDQNRQAVLGRDLEHGREALVIDTEGLGARVQLDAAGTRTDRALRLGERIAG